MLQEDRHFKIIRSRLRYSKEFSRQRDTNYQNCILLPVSMMEFEKSSVSILDMETCFCLLYPFLKSLLFFFLSSKWLWSCAHFPSSVSLMPCNKNISNFTDLFYYRDFKNILSQGCLKTSVFCYSHDFGNTCRKKCWKKCLVS